MQGLRAWRSVLVIGGLMAFMALVAIAAAGHAPSAGAARPSTPAPTLLQDYVLTLALLIMPIGLGLVIWAMVLQRIYKDVPLKKSKASAHVPVIVSIAVIVVLLVLFLRWAEPSRTPTLGVFGGGGGATSTGVTPPPPKDPPYEPQFRWLPIVVVGGLIVGIGGAMVVMALRRQRELLAATPLRETLADVVTETLDDLRREADPRKAVIAAYAKMERTLAARGIPRRESEAPVEYLTRILDVVSASGHSVRRLTGLFARARFSPHEIDAKMKEDAIEALTGLRAELQAP